MNLLSNAIKFTPVAGVIEIKIANNKNFLRISVKDNGVGISEQDQCKLFNSFIQINNSLTKTGTGLGLAISKRLVELLDGTIKVKSQLNTGSVFTFTCKHHPYKEFEKTIQKNTEILHDKYVLVVDDNIDNRLLLSDILFEWKMKPIICSSAIEALRLVLDDRYDFEFGLIDICMPGISGTQLAAKIKAERPLFPIIALSSLDGFANFSDFEIKLDKPINKIQLFHAIYRVITQNTHDSAYIGKRHINIDSSLSSSKSNSPSKSPLSKSNSPLSNFDKFIKILIVEDVIYNQTLLVNMLESMGYTNVTLASDGLEAIELIVSAEYQDSQFDLLLLDLRMPNMDGYEVIKYMKEKKQTIPKIIVITASVLTEDRQRCADFGVEYFINKPIQLNQLKNVLLRVCEKV